ncbi:transposase [Brevibacterium renqingii]|uniref:transposase n=1 Tax=Brevibacterium renqingii TaxID=2776916 RepID=UPI001AE052D4
MLLSFARRWINLDDKLKDLSGLIAELVNARAPQLIEQFCIDTATDILIVTGENPDLLKSEPAFVKLAGISPVPTGSGMTSRKHRINHSGHSTRPTLTHLFQRNPTETHGNYTNSKSA